MGVDEGIAAVPASLNICRSHLFRPMIVMTVIEESQDSGTCIIECNWLSCSGCYALSAELLCN